MRPLYRKAHVLEDEYDLCAPVLVSLMARRVDPLFFQWDFKALQLEMQQQFGPMGRVAKERMMALCVALANSSPWEEWEVFENVSCAINGVIPLFNVMQPQEPEHLARTVVALTALAPHKFSDEVLSYIAAQCLNAGFWAVESTVLAPAGEHIRKYETDMHNPQPHEAVAEAVKRGASPDDSVVGNQVAWVRAVDAAVSTYKARVAEQSEALRPYLTK